MRDGRLAWDPHPSRDGLVGVASAWALRPFIADRADQREVAGVG
jgi:hypothetical protein